MYHHSFLVRHLFSISWIARKGLKKCKKYHQAWYPEHYTWGWGNRRSKTKELRMRWISTLKSVFLLFFFPFFLFLLTDSIISPSVWVSKLPPKCMNRKDISQLSFWSSLLCCAIFQISSQLVICKFIFGLQPGFLKHI